MKLRAFGCSPLWVVLAGLAVVFTAGVVVAPDPTFRRWWSAIGVGVLGLAVMVCVMIPFMIWISRKLLGMGEAEPPSDSTAP